jgi:hypothetical protein
MAFCKKKNQLHAEVDQRAHPPSQLRWEPVRQRGIGGWAGCADECEHEHEPHRADRGGVGPKVQDQHALRQPKPGHPNAGNDHRIVPPPREE